jgi:SAM-dependent methyltransferase
LKNPEGDRTEEETSVEALSDEIRRAVAGAARAAPEAGSEGRDGREWSDLERFAIPSVEPGASMGALKRGLLRLLRVVTRPQGAFNMGLLESLRSLEHSLQGALARHEAAVEDLARAGDVLQARMTAFEAARGGPPAGPPARGSIPDGVYVRFEDAFRGAEPSVRERQAVYVDHFRGAPGVVLDCGCGRGEFLECLAAEGIAAEGVDGNAVSVELARAKGLRVACEDLFERLRTHRGDLGGVAALQVVEHLDPAAVFELLRLAHAALAPGGRIAIETINPDSLVALRAFRLDPTHRWAVEPETLDLLAREAGFSSRRIRYLSPVPESERLEERGENERKLNRWMFGPQDYALLAERPA